MHKLILSGYGGQGMLLCGQLLAYAAMKEGKHITWFPTYGAEVRGGAAYCSVVISEKAIGSPVIHKADIVVACSQPSLDKFHDFIVDGGLLVYHSAIVKNMQKRASINYLGVDFSALAHSVNFPKAVNMAVLGVLSVLLKIKRESVSEALKFKFSDKAALILEANETAVDLGINAARARASNAASGPQNL